MNFGRGFMIPPDQELPINVAWTPVTPDKPIPTRLYPNSVEKPALHQRGGYWHELLRSSGGLSQEMPSYCGGAENVDLIRSSSLNGNLQDPNFIAMKNPQGFNSRHNSLFGTDLEEFGIDGAAWNNIRLTDLLSTMNAAASLSPGNGLATNSNSYLVNRPQAPDFYSQLQTPSNLSNPHMAMLMLADQNCLNLQNQNHPFSVSTPQSYTTDGFPVPNKCNYNLNSPPAPEEVATSRVQSSSFAPATDQTKLEFNHNGMPLNLTAKESSCQDKEKQENNLNVAVSMRDADAGRNCFEFSQHLVELSPAALSTTTNKNNSNEVGHPGIDLNETPSQKPPKRRKHRPKVVVEGKPKRTPKLATPEKPKEKPSGKRKYVRRKGVNASTPQPEEVTKENATSTPKSKTKSCKRTLNFDLEGKTIDENKKKIDGKQKMQHPGGMLVFNLNAVGQERELLPGSQSIAGTNSSVQIDQQNRPQADIEQSEINPVLNHPMSQMVTGHMLLPRNNAPYAHSTTNKGQTMENSSASIQNTSTRNSNNCQDDRRNVYITSDQQSLNEGIGQAVLQAINHQNLERATQLKMWNNHQSLLKNLTNSNLATGIKRVSWHTTKQTHPQTVNQVEYSPFKAANDNNNSSHLRTAPENQKRQKHQDGHVSALSTRPHSNCRLEDISKPVQTNCTATINASHLTSEQEHRNLTSHFGENDVLAKLTSNTPVAGSYIPSVDSGPDLTNGCTSSDLPQQAQRRTNKRSRKATHVQDFVSPTTHSKSRKQSPTKQNPPSTDEQRIETGCADLASSSQNVMPVAFDLAPPVANKGLPQQNRVNDHHETHKRTQEFPKKHSYLDAVDEIMNRLNRIDLSKESNIAGQEQNALVLYKGDGALVPFDPVKKIKPPRPKVDLDPETNRVWNLLMGKEGSQGFEETDKEKVKWWEEERGVFQGRADSFIARMHLVQGDRRFSRWKGSVVDSVIGVFLTQNVSDHLSSSAFMSLVARFPFQSNNSRSCRKDEVILVEKSEICIIDQDDAIKWHEMVPREPIQKQSSATVYDPSGQIKATMMPSLGDIQSGRLEEEAASSQDSFDSSLLQVNGEVRSSSGSNSEAEDAATKCNADQLQCSTPPNLLYDEYSIFRKFFGQQTSPSYRTVDHGCTQSKEVEYGKEKQRFGSIGNLKEWSSVFNHSASSQSRQMHIPPYISQLNMPQYTEPPKADSFEFLGEEIISLPSTSEYMISSKKFDCISRRFEKMAENTRGSTVHRMAQSKFQELPRWDQCAPSGIYQNQQDNGSPPGAYTKTNEHLCFNHPIEKLQSMQQASPAVAKPSEVVQAQRNWKNCGMQQCPHTPEFNPAISDVERPLEVDKQVLIGSTATEQKTNESAHSAVDAYTGTNSNTPKTTKGRAPVDKRHAFNWDSLRKQVKTQERKRESSKDTLDSLNYEALRCAAVEEISDAIKERGMNKMLAERIKDFLNRLVEDHGSIDLEWLRDVPPDKAKEYLLSIRGLGLKSVECVRLLTLHHVAFPVDTNVGRIAVRLGWVPLQPLPESLQLHLLELYPVLETIQKYLWPRLCKLDQRTLYELHYQMITFGKVFCTKRTPNCNACPMKGECRHFASAFASARLALPGGEEKGLVSSSVPIATKGDSAIPMPLPLLENTQLGLGSRISNSEPIIEEPASPEPEHELTQSDIEDAYYEDSNEIPLIKLNMEEFTQNLQNYMESNMEIQEGDMSKALVALSAEAANIPVPKLKNVSRLRTEHQVYELPDSHPLLKDMDKREEDDPSPYLLAIWTPGETANSIQPPGNSCGHQEMGKLCNNTTCFSCNSEREANSLTVRGTLLIPCRTAMRGSFPLNGTYFQVNEVFADHESSLKPIEVPRAWLWNLPRRTVYFGTSVSTIFKGLSTEGIQYCFWRGFVCVRGFDQNSRAPRPLVARLHFPASKLTKTKKEDK